MNPEPDFGPQGTAAPYDLEAERAVLGAILVNNDSFFEVADVLQESDLFRAAHRQIYGAMRSLATKGQPIDLVTLCSHLRDKGELDQVGGPIYVTSLTDGVPRSTNVEFYAKLVVARAQRAALVRAADAIRNAALDTKQDDDELLDFAQQQIFTLENRGRRGDLLPASKMVENLYPIIEALSQGDKTQAGIPSGWKGLDGVIRGFRPGDLILLAGRPSMGKTAAALNVADHVARVVGLSVGMFSLEMSHEQLTMRLLSSVSQVDSHRLQGGYLREADYARIAEGMTSIGESSLYVDDTPEMGVFDMRSRARRLQMTQGLDLLIVDYLQLMKTPRGENRNMEVATLSRALKILARELRVPVIALSQLSRDAAKRGGDHRPQLSDLRDSGALEQDADVVIFVHRPEVYDAENVELHGLAELIVAKQRNGPIGIVKMVWLPDRQQFRDRAEY